MLDLTSENLAVSNILFDATAYEQTALVKQLCENYSIVPHLYGNKLWPPIAYEGLAYNALECTVLGFDGINDVLPLHSEVGLEILAPCGGLRRG